jgi:hypothetical protein
MTPLQRCIARNLAWRLGVQLPTFITYKVLSRNTVHH